MRELVYLSKRKLSQFHVGARRGFFSRITGFGAKAPLSMGEVSVTLTQVAQKELPELEAVIDAIESIERGAQWVDSENLEVGDWLTFDAKLNYAVHGEQGGGPLLFWEPLEEEEKANVHPWPPIMRRTLLLHGSVDGLLGGQASETDMSKTRLSMSDARPLFVALKRLAGSENVLGPQAPDRWQYALANLRSHLDREYPSFMASWLAGYARVTALLPPSERRPTGYVLATPLYVERVPAPADDQ